MTLSPAALVLFSGGQDSTVCLAWALDRYERVETIGFDYGQRHHVELDARLQVVLRQYQGPVNPSLGGPRWVKTICWIALPVLGQHQRDITYPGHAAFKMDRGWPAQSTFVPGRNLLFLTLAAALAYRRGLEVIVTGVCETDFSGYPDCRDDTMKAMQLALSLGMDKSLFAIETPLMWIDKRRHLGNWPKPWAASRW